MLRLTMTTASRTTTTTATPSGDAHAKTDGGEPHAVNGVDPVDDLEESDGDVVIPLRIEPLPQLSASLVDVDRGLRLIQSCRDGDFAAVQRQVSEGSPAGFVTKSGWTPIAAAAYGGKCEIVRYLLDLGADGMYAKSAKRFASAHTQQQQHVSPNPGGDSTASLASVDKPSSATSHPQLVADSSNGSIAGNLKLSDAASAPASAKRLLGNGANTPLHWACYKGHAEVVSVLLHAGYAIEDVDPIGNRALHLACSGGFCDVAEILLAHSAVVDQRNRYGNRPLDLTTDVACRKLLEKFQRTTQCEWCKESFNRLRRASLCQHCHNVYCDVKPCSSVSEMVIGTLAVDQTPTPPGSAATATAAVGAGRSMRYCQECATEMGQTEQELRSILDAKLELIRTTVEMITRASTPSMDSPPASALTSSRPSTQASGSGSGRPVTAAASGSGPPSSESSGHGSSSSDTVGGDPVGFSDTDNVESLLASPADLEPPRPLRRLPPNDEITKTLTLSQTDAEALYTSIEAAQLKAVDRELVARAKQTYRQLVAHVALQEEIQSLMAVRPIGVRSLVAPLKTALLNAQRESVSPEMLLLGVQVVRSAEAECTLFGCEALCAKIELATQKHRRDIARLEASVRESQAVGVHDKLLASAVALRDRLHAEVQLQACLQPFTPVVATSETAVTTAYRFEDGTEAATLLQALELRNQKIQSAVDFGGTVEGVSSALLEEGLALLKQLKKDIKEETKNEEERRRLEEEAALKAAKKGKKKKA